MAKYQVISSFGGKKISTHTTLRGAKLRASKSNVPVDVWTTSGGYFGMGVPVAHFSGGKDGSWSVSRKQNPAVSLPRNKWVNASIRITSDGKIQAKVSSPALSRSIRKRSNPRKKNPKGVSESWLNQPDTEATKRKMMKLARTSNSLKTLYKVYVWAGAWNRGGDVFVGNDGIRYVIHNRLKKHGMTDREAFGRFGL